MGLPISMAIVSPCARCSASRMSAARRIERARSAKVVRRCERNAAAARSSLASTSSSVSGAKVWSVSPVAGLIVAIAMVSSSRGRGLVVRARRSRARAIGAPGRDAARFALTLWKSDERGARPTEFEVARANVSHHLRNHMHRLHARVLQNPRARLALKLAATLLALGLAALSLHGVPLSAMVARLAAFPRWAFVAAVAASLAQVALLTARLWIVAPRGERPGFLAVARAYAFGQLGNALLPARSGDVVKVATLARSDASDPHAKRTKVGAATSIVLVDKALDVLTFAGLAAVAGRGLAGGALAGAAHLAWILFPALALAGLCVLALHRLRPTTFARLRDSASSTRAAARRMLAPRRLGAGILLGAAGWVAELAAMIAIGVGLGVHLPVVQVLGGLVVLNLGISVPVSLANVGTYEAATVAGLVPFGVPAASALAIGALHHAVQLLAAVVPALVFWTRDRIQARAPREEEPAAAALLLAAPVA